MSPWTRLITVACALWGILAAPIEARNRRGSAVAETERRSLVPPGAYCGPCDVRACPTIQAESCPGLVVKDECNCCPVCHESLTTDSPVEDLNFTSSKNESGCASVKCPRMQICMHNIQGLPLCRCPSVYHCRQYNRKPLCGRDGNTYKNRCYLQMTECSQGKKIRVAYMSKCKGEDSALTKEERKEERKKKRKERRKNRKRFKKQRRKDKHTVVETHDDTDDSPTSTIAPPNLQPLDPKGSADNNLDKLSAKEKRRQRRKEKRQKKRKLKRREKRRRQRRRLRRSCTHESHLLPH